MNAAIMQIDEGLANWLKRLADSWRKTPQDVSIIVASEEIRNRIDHYPHVRDTLQSPIDLQGFASAARECWVLRGYHDAIRFNAFVSKNQEASTAIEELLCDFPLGDSEAAERINSFIEKAVTLGISKPDGGEDRAGGAQLASLILSSVNPQRFPDYRRSRWEKMASAFGYPVLSSKASHGEWIVWAGKFAFDLSRRPG